MRCPPRSRLLTLSTIACLVALACTTLSTGVVFTPHADAPALTPRPDGCYVEVLEVGQEPTRPHVVVGALFLRVTKDDLRLSATSIAERFREAGCAYGAFLIKDLKAYPDPARGVVEYQATAALLIDERGEPLLVPSSRAE